MTKPALLVALRLGLTIAERVLVRSAAAQRAAALLLRRARTAEVGGGGRLQKFVRAAR